MEVGCVFQFGAPLLQSTSVLLALFHETLPPSVHFLHLNHRHRHSICRQWVLAWLCGSVTQRFRRWTCDRENAGSIPAAVLSSATVGTFSTQPKLRSKQLGTPCETLAPCPRSCSFGWRLAGSHRICDQCRPYGLSGSGMTLLSHLDRASQQFPNGTSSHNIISLSNQFNFRIFPDILYRNWACAILCHGAVWPCD